MAQERVESCVKLDALGGVIRGLVSHRRLGYVDEILRIMEFHEY